MKDGLAHGQGTCTYPNGDIHIGQFKHDERSGHGSEVLGENLLQILATYYYQVSIRMMLQMALELIYWANGNKYIGEHKADSISGLGTYSHGLMVPSMLR
ncbi:MAG: hypothetical protein ACJ0FW_04115 [Gammaproteobacteria bacterium]